MASRRAVSASTAESVAKPHKCADLIDQIVDDFALERLRFLCQLLLSASDEVTHEDGDFVSQRIELAHFLDGDSREGALGVFGRTKVSDDAVRRSAHRRPADVRRSCRGLPYSALDQDPAVALVSSLKVELRLQHTAG
jgi:hypothetical protein